MVPAVVPPLASSCQPEAESTMADARDSSLNLISVILARAGSDPALRAQLVAGGARALRALGVGIPDGITVTIIEDSATVRHFVIPAPEGTGELSDTDLEKVSGGAGPQQLGRRGV
jgi:hypothetical protein